MEGEAVYLKIDRHIEIKCPSVCVRDLGSVCCSNPKLSEVVGNLQVFQFSMDESGQKKTASVMVIIDKINRHFKNDISYIQNIGENEFAMSLNFEQKMPKGVWYKILPVTLITLFGSMFSIMTYNEDVGTRGVFEKLTRMMGVDAMGVEIMAVAYGIGIAVGIVLFFNHFGKKKLTNDPTPMEVEMEKYEADVEDTLIKEAARRGENIDIS